MKLLGPTRNKRLNEALAFVYLLAAFFVFLALVSYNPFDSSLNTATVGHKTANLTGPVGAWMSDLLLQFFGLAAFLVPVLILMLAWEWIRNIAIDTPMLSPRIAIVSMANVGARRMERTATARSHRNRWSCSATWFVDLLS